jgi:hypothetical protein
MNAFDLIVTASVGSTLVTIALIGDAALAQGLLALAVLVALQFVITMVQRPLGLGPPRDYRSALTAPVRWRVLQAALGERP